MESATSRDSFPVEKILDKRMVDGKAKYLVKWAGFPDSANSWEFSRNLTHCKHLIAAFENKQGTNSVVKSATPKEFLPAKRIKEESNAEVKEPNRRTSQVSRPRQQSNARNKNNARLDDFLQISRNRIENANARKEKNIPKNPITSTEMVPVIKSLSNPPKYFKQAKENRASRPQRHKKAESPIAISDASCYEISDDSDYEKTKKKNAPKKNEVTIDLCQKTPCSIKHRKFILEDDADKSHSGIRKRSESEFDEIHNEAPKCPPSTSFKRSKPYRIHTSDSEEKSCESNKKPVDDPQHEPQSKQEAKLEENLQKIEEAPIQSDNQIKQPESIKNSVIGDNDAQPEDHISLISDDEEIRPAKKHFTAPKIEDNYIWPKRTQEAILKKIEQQNKGICDYNNFETMISDHWIINGQMYFEIKVKLDASWKELGYFTSEECRKRLPQALCGYYEKYLKLI